MSADVKRDVHYVGLMCPDDAPLALLEDEREHAYRDMVRYLALKVLALPFADRGRWRAAVAARFTFEWQDWRPLLAQDEEGELVETGQLRAAWCAVPKREMS
jgi:hypothetical protein